MEYRHFLLLAGRMDRNERKLAYYLALAFNSPKDLMTEDENELACESFDTSELLSACNGV